MSYTDRLLALNLESLEVRHIKADLVLYYKVLNGVTNVNTGNCIKPFHSHRGHSKNLYHFYSRTEIRKKLLVQQNCQTLE